MNVADIFYRFLHPEVPPPPAPPSGLPSDEEILRAKQQVANLVKRAEALGIEVQMEEITR